MSSSTIREVDGSIKSRNNSRRKLGSRRTITRPKDKSKTIVMEDSNTVRVDFREDVLVETESPSNEIKHFYDNIKDRID